jgi:hypothetical protein
MHNLDGEDFRTWALEICGLYALVVLEANRKRETRNVYADLIST